MPKLIWHPDALGDIARLYDFLALTSPVAAERAAMCILQGAEKIVQNSGIGTPHAEFREWPEKFGKSAYIIRYLEMQTGDVLIVRIWNSRELRID